VKIRCLTPWYGSKRTLAPRIVAELGDHSVYWEPFCGSCAVLFAKPKVTYESVNDLHEDLINLAMVVQDEASGQRLYGRVYRTIFHEEMMPIAKEKIVSPLAGKPDEERAYWYLVFSWMALNGISGTPLHSAGTFCARFSSKGGHGATRWRSMVESIPDWHERLRGVQILSRDAFKLIDDLDDAAGTSLYIDAPYVTKGAKYVHDFKAADHERLAEQLQRFKAARIVVSYYEHPDLEPLYCGWTKIRCNGQSVSEALALYR
jgi:DNA adenine methylase